MYRQALMLLVRTWGTGLCAAAIVVSAWAWQDRVGRCGASSLLVLVVHLAALARMLTALDLAPADPVVRRIAWRRLAVIIAICVAAISLSPVLTFALIGEIRITRRHGFDFAGIAVVMALAAGTVVVLALLAPALAAIAAGEQAPFWTLVRTRGRRQFFSSLQDLCTGAVLLSVGSLAALVILVPVSAELGVANEVVPVLESLVRWGVVTVPGNVLVVTMQLYVIALAAVAMRRSYERDLTIKPTQPHIDLGAS
jgi:hypothetical protein